MMTCFLLVLVVLVVGQVVIEALSFDAVTSRRTISNHPSYSSRIRDAAIVVTEDNGGGSSRMMKTTTTLTDNNKRNKRREFLHRAMAQIVIVPTVIVVPVALVSHPSSASAAATITTTTTTKPPPILPLLTTAKRLHAIPTFAIVDGHGVPFHTYDKDTGGGLGYFFTSYRSAEFVLDDAKAAFAKAKAGERSSNNVEAGGGNVDEKVALNEGGAVPDSWGLARIVSIPLDVAIQLTVKKTTTSIAQNGQNKSFNTYYQVIPSQEEVNAALRIEDGPRYRERGRVPLFYIDGLQIPLAVDDDNTNNNKDGSVVSSSGSIMMNPVYLHVQDLKDEWQRQHPNNDNTILSSMPPIKVRELNETFRAMIRPGGKDDSLTNLFFIPSSDNVGKAKAILSGDNNKYRLGEMILTK